MIAYNYDKENLYRHLDYKLRQRIRTYLFIIPDVYPKTRTTKVPYYARLDFGCNLAQNNTANFTCADVP